MCKRMGLARVHWYDYDPTKWGLSVAAALGLVWDLKRSDVNEMRKARLEVREQALAAERAQLQWGAEAANLPTMTIAKLRKAVDLGELLVVLDGYVLNVGHFVDDHPGGEQVRP